MRSAAARRFAVVGLRCAVLAWLVPAAACRPRTAAPLPEQTVILVSIDGFRADYLDRGHTPHLAALAARGVRAQWLAPTFPTKTFPQHYTIATGMYPARHGIVGNSFVDRTDGARFRYTDSLVAPLSRWWGGEPVWVTAERQGVRAANLFWPGSEAEIGGVRASRWKKYDEGLLDTARVDTVLAWLALPAGERPRFVSLYFSEVDDWGHDTGPDSPELNAALRRADAVIGRLVRGLERLDLPSLPNLVIVSDHGMIATTEQRLVFVEDLVDTTAIRVIEGGPFVALSTGRDVDPDSVLASLSRSPHLRLYRGGRTPDAWRYTPGPRIPDIVGVAEDGWLLTSRAALARRRNRYNGGDHGYDPASPGMRALFIAAGPAIRSNQVVPAFTNIHVYALMCAILGIAPGPNDGSLDSVRLVLK